MKAISKKSNKPLRSDLVQKRLSENPTIEKKDFENLLRRAVQTKPSSK